MSASVLPVRLPDGVHYALQVFDRSSTLQEVTRNTPRSPRAGFALQELLQLGPDAEDQIRIGQLERQHPGAFRPARGGKPVLQGGLLGVIDTVLGPQVQKRNAADPPQDRTRAEEGAMLPRRDGAAVPRDPPWRRYTHAGASVRPPIPPPQAPISRSARA